MFKFDFDLDDELDGDKLNVAASLRISDDELAPTIAADLFKEITLSQLVRIPSPRIALRL